MSATFFENVWICFLKCLMQAWVYENLMKRCSLFIEKER